MDATAFLHIVRAARPHIVDGGSIDVMSSQAARVGGGGGAVMTMMRGLAKELAPKVRAKAGCPGMIDTDFHDMFTKPEVRARVANVTPPNREGRWLISPISQSS